MKRTMKTERENPILFGDSTMVPNAIEINAQLQFVLLQKAKKERKTRVYIHSKILRIPPPSFSVCFGSSFATSQSSSSSSSSCPHFPYRHHQKVSRLSIKTGDHAFLVREMARATKKPFWQNLVTGSRSGTAHKKE